MVHPSYTYDSIKFKQTDWFKGSVSLAKIQLDWYCYDSTIAG